eukprot:4948558-Prymnesium_polylepis.1
MPTRPAHSAATIRALVGPRYMLGLSVRHGSSHVRVAGARPVWTSECARLPAHVEVKLIEHGEGLHAIPDGVRCPLEARLPVRID